LKSNNGSFDLSSDYIDKLQKYLLLCKFENKIYIPSNEVDSKIPTKESILQHNIKVEEELKIFDNNVNIDFSIIRNSIKRAYKSKDSIEKRNNLIKLRKVFEGLINYVEKTIDEKLKINEPTTKQQSINQPATIPTTGSNKINSNTSIII
jgi:hypothetical protein